MGNIQANEKQFKTGKSPAKGKHFIRNLNRKSPGRESKKHGRKKSDTKRDAIDREFDKTPDSDNVDGIETFDNDTAECVFKTLRREGESEASVQSEVTVTRCESRPRSPTRSHPATAAAASPTTSDSVFTDPLTPLAVELNQCYYSAESDSVPDELARTLTPDHADACDPDMPHDDAASSLSTDDAEKEEKVDVFDDSYKGENEKVMGAIFSGARGEHLERITHECNHEFRDNRLKACPGQTSFTLSKHRKVELPPVTCEPSLTILDDEPDRRHSSLSDTPLTESNVLRKVASLTLDKLTESRVVRPRFVPEKLDFQLYEKFEGQMLLNWFVSSIAENNHLKNLLSAQDLKNLGVQYCTHLLAAGVLRQISDKDAPTENIFRPNLMYYWAHMEAPASQPVTPGRLLTSAWPPDKESNIIMQEHITNNCHLENNKFFNQNNNEEISDISEAKVVISQLKRKLQELEFQLEKMKITAQVETLNRNLENFDSKPEYHSLAKNKAELINREVQTSNIANEVDKLTNKPVINIPEYDPVLRTNVNIDTALGLSSLAYRNDKIGDNEFKPEVRSEKIENYCKLNKSREYNKSFRKDENTENKEIIDNKSSIKKLKEDIVNQSPKESNHTNLSTCESSSDASFVSTCTSTEFISDQQKSSSDLIRQGNILKKSANAMDIATHVLYTKDKENQFTSKQNHQTPTPTENISQNEQSKEVKYSVDDKKMSPVISPDVKLSAESAAVPPKDETPVLSQESAPPLPSHVPLPPSPPPSPTSSQPPLPPPPPLPGMTPPPPPTPGTNSTSPPSHSMGPPPPPMPDTEFSLSGAVPPPPPPMEGMGPPPPPMPGMGPPPPMPGMGPPPPPMPGMGPPPPPMPGMGPPPPPMPGMGPPPPPMPGMGPPPPPMPGMCPPPPPMPGMGMPPPPPMPGMGPPPPPMAGMPGAGPPPPGPPPPPSAGPVPFPPPPVGGWSMQRATLRKIPVKPAAPMKPLYWTRILAAPQLPAAQGEVIPSPLKPLWLEIEETKLDNIEEFTDLFSRQVVKAPVKKKVEVKTKIQPIKILDSKRSQNVGILAQSLHVEFSEIENAIYNFDTSVVSLEALQQIYELRATDEELAMIKEHMKMKPDIPLDKPEAFLHDLSGIPNFAERISCFMFQADFEDAVSTTMHKLDNLKHTCEFLMTSESLKKLFAIILTLGNYMNGGNGQRGQADGFGLEILSKLKDVKSKQSNVTLLHFIVRTYMRSCGGALSSECTLPIPEPGDVVRAAALDFADVAASLNTLQEQLKACQAKTKKVIDTDNQTRTADENSPNESSKRLEVFQEKMTTFLNAAEEKLKTEHENLEECRSKFITTVKFYQYTSKCGKPEDCEPKEFFSLWTSFCSDFKDIYKKEEQLAIKEKLKEAKKMQEERKSLTQPKKEGGLKARLQKLSSTTVRK